MFVARTQVLLAALCFATTGTAQALGPAGTHPVGVGAARILVGGTLLVAVVLLRGSGFRSRPWARGPLLAAVGGVAVYQLAFFAAVADTGVAVGTIVALGSAPTLAGLFEWVLDRRRPTARWSRRDGARLRRRRPARARRRRARASRSPASRSPSPPAGPTRRTRSRPSACWLPAMRPRR